MQRNYPAIREVPLGVTARAPCLLSAKSQITPAIRKIPPGATRPAPSLLSAKSQITPAVREVTTGPRRSPSARRFGWSPGTLARRWLQPRAGRSRLCSLPWPRQR